MKPILFLSMFLAGIAQNAAAWHPSNAQLEVLVKGTPLPQYSHSGTTYLEALKGKEYAIRITNPMGTRIAVALSVDGLNTIDSRHTEAGKARKWVLEPYQSIVINGWQTSTQHARRFFFTTEERSYGAWKNEKENLGIISAAFFKERIRPPMSSAPYDSLGRDENRVRADASSSAELKGGAMAKQSQPEYAATGMGNRVHHEVEMISMELEDAPFAVIDLRYEFRPVLVQLGVIPPLRSDNPVVRREHAQGFKTPLFCPEP